QVLPKRVAVIGLGVIGIELGQALSRLGVEVFGIGLGQSIGGLSEPELQEYSLRKFREEFPIWTSGAEKLAKKDGKLLIKVGKETLEVERAFLTMGRKPNLAGLGLEKLGLSLDHNGVPSFEAGTYKLRDLPIFLVGDANHERPILHEAADEGRIAGYN